MENGGRSSYELAESKSSQKKLLVLVVSVCDSSYPNIHYQQTSTISRGELLRKRTKIVQYNAIWSSELDRSHPNRLQK